MTQAPRLLRAEPLFLAFSPEGSGPWDRAEKRQSVKGHCVHGVGGGVVGSSVHIRREGRDLFYKCAGGYPGGAPNLTIMSEKFDGQ